MDKELERFKTEIDLREFAASLGFEFNRRDSWRGSAVMERGAQDKIIISRGHDGHFVYFSVKDSHGGTIIDLAKRYVTKNFGHIRKTLREWSDGRTGPSHAFTATPLETTSKDLQAVARVWHGAQDCLKHAWLENERAIPSSLFTAPRFAGRLKVDSIGNALFAHANADGHICGFEKKNKGFTGFAAGGEKGLGCSNTLGSDERLVLAESFIDMLSYAALFPDERARYASFGGGLSTKQPEIIRGAILTLARGAEVVAATDGDEAGAKFAATIQELCEGYSFREHRPSAGDWNDALRGHSLPTARYANEP